MSTKTDPSLTFSLVDKNDKGYSFVSGNTKSLKDMNQKELAILHKNGDPRVKGEEIPEDKKPVKPAASTPTV